MTIREITTTNVAAVGETVAASTVNQRVWEADGSAEQALARGDHREALARCARDHGASLGRLCMALTGSQAEADELVQEVLLAAHDSFDSFRGDGSLRAWLFGIARRVCARHVETRSRHARLRLVHPLGRASETRAPSTDEVAIRREDAARARRALETLKPTEREAILLRYGSELPFRDVAEACGVDEPTVRKRVSRALGRLREWLANEETSGQAATKTRTKSEAGR